jgi:hypothetical protein
MRTAPGQNEVEYFSLVEWFWMTATSSGLVSAIWLGWAKAFGARRSAEKF